MRARARDGRAAVIGFCGAPFTLACYLIEGRPSRDYARAKTLMMREPDVWAALMDRLTDGMIALSARPRSRAGADVIQVFDSWVGALAPSDYERSVLPWMRRIFAALRAAGCADDPLRHRQRGAARSDGLGRAAT